jgi:hypothetical protein
MTNFNGFESPNFTQIPNEYLDYTFSPECDLSKVQMQIMNFVFRETFGWQDKHKILVFSATDIMALLNIKNRNQVVNALNGLVYGHKFLESITVSDLSKKVRSNIEKSLGRTLQPKQKIYRLNLIEGKKRRWDNIEEPHTDLQERKEQFKGSIKSDTTTSIKSDTTTSIKSDTTLEDKSLDTVGVEPPLNKGLNKDLNKLEEEEENNHSELVSFLLLKDITLENAIKFETRLLEEGLTGYTNDDVIEAIKLSLTDFVNGVCNSPYKWAVGKLKYILDSKTQKTTSEPNKARKGKVIHKELLPDWFDENEPEQHITAESSNVDQEQKKQEIEEMLRQLRG